MNTPKEFRKNLQKVFNTPLALRWIRIFLKKNFPPLVIRTGRIHLIYGNNGFLLFVS